MNITIDISLKKDDGTMTVKEEIKLINIPMTSLETIAVIIKKAIENIFK